ncbi:hypothetical protein DFH08DRAFT_687039, partial [Mycena albidolilacea]
LLSTRGTESPDVMLSRAESLDGVFILRPFRQKVIQCRPSEDVRNELTVSPNKDEIWDAGRVQTSQRISHQHILTGSIARGR